MSSKKSATSRFHHAALRGCAIAIAVILLFFLAASLTVNYAPAMDFASFVILVLFSLEISFAKEIFAIHALTMPTKWILNFVLNAVACLIVILLTTKAFVVGIVLYVIAYAAVAGLSFLVHLLFPDTTPKEKSDNKEEYTSRFS